MEKLPNVHPGAVLSKEFLFPLGITACKLARELGIPQSRINEILKENQRITAETALRLSRYFGTTARFWLDLQNDYDLEQELSVKADEIAAIKKIVVSTDHT